MKSPSFGCWSSPRGALYSLRQRAATFRWLVLLPSSAVLINNTLHAQALPGNVAPAISSKSNTDSSLGKQVVAFCREHLGKRVGDGECTSLVNGALESAAARASSGSSPGRDDYAWGDLVALIEAKRTIYDREAQARQAGPGDIIQFRDAVFASSDNHNHSIRRHHTAVVVAVTDYGRQIQICEQNVNEVCLVFKNTLDVDDMREGWMRIYHPIAKE
jgi:hypothetical protein